MEHSHYSTSLQPLRESVETTASAEEALNVPVWTDEYTRGNQGYFAERSPMVVEGRLKLKEATVNEAFALIDSGVVAENEGRYKAAANFFIEAGEMLAMVVDQESDPLVKSLLNQKGREVLSWTESLSHFIDGGEHGEPPKRLGQTVLVNKIGALGREVKELTGNEETEFNSMFYTACSTKSPMDFTNDGYRLQCIQNSRRPQLMVVITMYNEDKHEIKNTLRKVANNIKVIKEKGLPGYEGEESWKNVLVVVVSDGRTQANHGTLEYLKEIGLYDEDAMNITMKGIDVMCHLFEFSVQLIDNRRKEVYPPMQVVFALKEHNAGKLNSHEWYFNAFAEQIGPEYTVLLDVGTLPTKTAFLRLLMALEINPQIGGTCGEIAVDRPIPNMCNWIVSAQHFEYKVSNFLDKSLESVFGYISVLPGAFSAYRYRAIRGAPLKAYFKSLTTPMHVLGPFQGNMYLAEDRILCFELLARKGQKWTMHYVKDAIARTDVPTNLVSLIGQRRRWLNGSFFAMVYTLLNWGRVFTESNHSSIRKFFLFLQYVYMSLSVVLGWFLISNFFLVTYYMIPIGLLNDRWGFISTDGLSLFTKDVINQVFYGSYAVVFFAQLIAGLGNKPKHYSLLYSLACVYYGLLMSLTTAIAVGFVFLPDENNELTFSTTDLFAAGCTVGVFFIASLLHMELHHILMSFIQYFSLLPTFVNVLCTYSFCNLHDLSWGTKGIETSDGHGPKQNKGNGLYKDAVLFQKQEEARKKTEATIKDKMTGHFQAFRSNLLLFWLVTNTCLAYGVMTVDTSGDNYLTILFYIVAVFNIIRLIGSILYLLYHFRQSLFILCGVRKKMKRRLNERRKQYSNKHAHDQQFHETKTPQTGFGEVI